MKRIFESKNAALAPVRVFYKRMLISFIAGSVLTGIALFVGMLGYKLFERMSWPDAFLNASMILSGMGPVGNLNTFGGKIFAGCYALFSGLAFIMIIGLILSPIVHRFFHKFHVQSG